MSNGRQTGETDFVSATAYGTSGPMSAARGKRAFPAGTGSEEPGVLNQAGADDVAEQAMRALHTEQLRHRLREVLAALPDDQREAVRLRLFDGMNNAEMAPLLGVTVQRASWLWQSGFTTLWSALRADPAIGLEEEESAGGLASSLAAAFRNGPSPEANGDGRCPGSSS